MCTRHGVTLYKNDILSVVSSVCMGMNYVLHQVHVCTLCLHVRLHYYLHFTCVLNTGCFIVLLLLAYHKMVIFSINVSCENRKKSPRNKKRALQTVDQCEKCHSSTA